MTKKKYTFIDLFAGCGGLSEGFLQTGRFNALAHVEWEKPMVDTLRNRLVDRWGESINDSKRKVILFDIQKTQNYIAMILSYVAKSTLSDDQIIGKRRA